MPTLLFYFFAAITLGFGLLVVTARNPVTSALSLAMSFVGLAALFIGLNAYLLGILQILVYAGAVMVLFLFIIMLLDIKAQEGKQLNLVAIVGGIALAVMLSLQVAGVAGLFEAGKTKIDDVPIAPQAALAAMGDDALPTIRRDLEEGSLPDAKLMGVVLFRDYIFHIQAMGLLLLVGTVGVVVLSKRDDTPTTKAG